MLAVLRASPIAPRLARVLLTFLYWSSGFARVVDWKSGLTEMAHFGLQPAWAFSMASIVVQIGGSVLLIWGRWAWLGAGALILFTLAVIPIAHDFWNLSGGRRVGEMYTVVQHVSLIGGLILAAMTCRREAQP